MDEQWQRRSLKVITYTPGIVLAVLGPLAVAFCSESQQLVVALGLMLEMAGVLAILGRALAEEWGLWLVRAEADRSTLPLFFAGAVLLPIGFLLQFVAVVFM